MSNLFEQPPPSEERPKPVVLDHALPSTPNDWARYVCPDQARQIFRTNSNPHCINTHSITKQARLHGVFLLHISLSVITIYLLLYCL